MTRDPTTHDERDALLSELHEFGRRTHAGLPLPLEVHSAAVMERVAARLQRTRLDATPENVANMLRTTSGADLYLAVCCDRAVPGAWVRLTHAYEPRVRKLALHLGCRDVDGVSADLFGDLSSPGNASYAKTRLGSYLGTGTLFAWMGVILRRQLVDVARAQSRHRLRISREAPLAPDDPLESAMLDELSGRVRDLLHLAWETLDDQERLVLLFKYREGLDQRTIASVMKLSESRISRIVSQAIARVRSSIGKRLRAEQPERWANRERTWHALMHVVALHLSQAGPVERPTHPREARNG